MNSSFRVLMMLAISLSAGGSWLAVSPAHADVLVAGAGEDDPGYITRYTNAGVIESSWSISGGPDLSTVQFDGLAVNGNTIYAADRANKVIDEYNLTTGQFIDKLPIGTIQNPGPLKVNNGQLYVSDFGVFGGTGVYKINLSNNVITPLVNVTTAGGGLYVAPNGDAVVGDLYAGQAIKYTAATNTQSPDFGFIVANPTVSPEFTPSGILQLANGHYLVSDLADSKIIEYGQDGSYIGVYHDFGPAPNESFPSYGPSDIIAGPNNDILVAMLGDTGAGAGFIADFDSMGNLTDFGPTGLDSPDALALVPDAAVPEPSAVVALIGLCATGMIGLVWKRRRKMA